MKDTREECTDMEELTKRMRDEDIRKRKQRKAKLHEKEKEKGNGGMHEEWI